MNTPLRTRVGALALVAAVSAATTAVVLPVATAQSPAPAPQMVVGLPDFTHLVEQVGPGVVNVEATMGGSRGRSQARGPDQLPDDAEIPEIFRRFFGPGMPLPGVPQDPRGAGPRGVSQGTGFIISGDGYVLTNHHVIDGADSVKVKLSDRREYTARVVGSDEQSDVALLKIDASGLPALRLGDSNQLKPGQWVVAIGSPFGLDHSVTAGIVSAVGRSNPYAGQQYVPFIQTDVAINRGNSGGPLLNTRGEVVGINSQIFSNSGGYMGVSFAIPIDLAMNSVKQLKATGKVQRGMIGVGLQAIDADTARGMGLPDTRGALIREVSPGSPGEKAGLQTGDVIRSADGRAVDQSSDLPPIIGAMAPGTSVRLGILRDGKLRNVDVVLAPLDEGLLAGNDGQAPGGAPASPARASSNPLGLVGEALDANDRRQLGLQPGEGVGIARVEGLAARSAGVRAGDVVLKVGREAVGSPAALDRALRDAKPGQTVMLLISRNGSSQFVAVAPRAEEAQ
jgi:serine protease Do